ncbi:hypothetical protein Tco_0732754 [Tanacetum coccineum]
MLGVPMGEVYINARNETDFRNPLAHQWKAQFGKALKRHYNTHVANEIVEKGCSGSWKRDGFYNGPIILLLVLYAHSHIPVKIWSSDMLNKLEADVFPKDDGGDIDVGEEAELEVSDEEQVLEEDDVEEDYYSVGVPTDLEGMKKYESALLKKAGELVEMADEVLEQGLENNPTDSSFIELKELRNQLFAIPTKVEQIPTRLNFNEADDIDLNGTQPPATQGKVVGGAEDENNIEEDESLLDAIENYV